MNSTHILTRRRLVQAIALALTVPGGSAMAQAWPSKPISLIVPSRPAAPPTCWPARSARS